MRAIAVLLVLTLASSARADTRALAEARAVLPAKLAWIGGANLTDPAVRTIARNLWRRAPQQQVLADGLTKSCGGDLPDLVDSVVVASFDEESEQTVLVIGLATLRRDTFEKCLRDVFVGWGDHVDITREGDVSRYTVASGGSFSARWLADDVLAAGASDDAALLAKMTAGGFANDRRMKALVAKVVVDAPLWAAVAEPGTLESLGEAPASAWGAITIVKGDLRGEASLEMRSAATATRALARMKTALVDLRKELGALGPFLDKVTATVKARTLRVTVTITDADIAAAMKALAGLSHQ
ncbi:MAG TPA: hypothetical protein VL463_02435 [Kofleriaceae bacterium]|nr:hypothetical protein [Kofleriaceae bacterium]